MSKYKSRSEVPEKYKWDLTDFFKDDKEFSDSLNKAKKMIEEEKKYVGCTKDSNKLYEYLKYDLELGSLVENLYVYAFLKDDEELGNSMSIDRKNKAFNLVGEYSAVNSFFNPELLELSKEEYNKLFDNENLSEYKFFLDEIYKNKDHILSEKEEVIINNLEVAMNNFEDISSNLINNELDYGKIKIDDEEVEIHTTNYRKLSKNKDNNIRKEVSNKLKGTLDNHGQTFASLLDSFVKSNNTNAKLHNFKDAWDEKLFDYNMPEEAYNALIESAEKNTKVLQKYYRLFKEVLGLKELHKYDLNLDLEKSNKSYTIEESINLVRKALNPLGEEYLKCYDKIIDNHYIDFCEYKGKCSGGYSASTSDHDSRILMSFTDDLESVSTIAHECGHNVHHQIISKNNPIQYRDVSTLVSEVASLTNECLLSNYLGDNGETKEEKLSGISNILGVFECNFFGSVREGKMENDFYNYSLDGNSITKDYMNELDLNSLKKYYGNEVIIDDHENTGWIRRSHYYMNFYLYNYAFCISVAFANALKILNGDKNQLERYLKFLSLGSDTYPIDAFKVLGFDLTDKKVYDDAIKYFDSLIEKYKEVSKE